MENLKELHLPAMRGCFEETARRAEKKTLSYERYLLELAQRECEERRRKRIGKLLKESGLPLEKSLANFDGKRLPVKVSRQMKVLLEGGFLDRRDSSRARSGNFASLAKPVDKRPDRTHDSPICTNDANVWPLLTLAP